MIYYYFIQIIYIISYHQSPYYTAARPIGFSSFAYRFPCSYSYYSRRICSCWLRIVSMSLAMNRSTFTSHSWSTLINPRSVITSLAKSQKIIEIDLGTLLLHGITTSMNYKGASVLQRAIVGILTYEASITAWLSLLGSATMSNLGSWNFLVI